MIKRFFNYKTFLGSLFALSSMLAADQGPGCALIQEEIPCCNPSQLLVEFKAGYFNFTDSRLRKIYDKGGLDLQLATSYPLCNLACGWTLHAYGALEYFRRSGKSIHGHQHSVLWSVPVNIGLKPVYTISDSLEYYFAIGPRFFYLNQHNHSSYVPSSRSRNGCGLFVNTGFNYNLSECSLINLFGEYSYGKVRFHSGRHHVYSRSTHIGGYTFGGGLGYKF